MSVPVGDGYVLGANTPGSLGDHWFAPGTFLLLSHQTAFQLPHLPLGYPSRKA